MRKLALTTTLALAAMAMTATSAMAAIEVRDPDTGQLCPAVSPAINATNAAPGSTTRNYVSGGCTIQMHSEGTHRIYTSSSSAISCESNFTVHVGPDGWGYAENFNFPTCNPNAASQCTGDRLIAPPDYTGPAGSPFPYFSFADASSDLNLELCANVVAAARWGYVSMDITYPGAGWRWTNQYNDFDPLWTTFFPPQKHRDGRWTSLSNDSLQITHL